MMIREATMADYGRLGELYAQLIPADLLFGTADSKHVFEEILPGKHLHLFVLEDEHGDIQASSYLNVIPNMSRGASPYAFIENVITDELARGQGVGKRLLKHVVEFAWNQGCYKVALLTGCDDTHEFYTACGFDDDRKFAFEIRNPQIVTKS
ncbi:MAG: GNAT family N-acetyltransferase [Rhodospirillales bacterium]|jgi:GNAT superfamily N-acetyltransferase|nr:GNAT family N-acetyltransferase [Rhodospirillales bacterium]MBT4040718.1 GNAT family N-acetyltransferase [Rhodospirillales bacterium]MBT4628044.1 GNAT family N-acetyltransferase [Rhodospirillales bacterium]MBT5350273.1 GNAT family N-acetyltransferase [Rhodospirillales bacterium]MBT5522312.1 GNAT family N-acetyltransferase [Rhodospirillales bacterium]